MTHSKQLIALIPLLSWLLSCAPPPTRIAPSPAVTPTQDTTKTDPGDSDGTGTKTDPQPMDTPIVIPPGWSLRSPASKSTSTDATPLITGKDLLAYAGGTAHLYKDSACSQLLAESPISDAGLASFTSLRFKTDGSDDGEKAFFFKTTTAQKTSSCEDSKLNYTLKTDTPLAKARYFRLTFKNDPSTTMNIGFGAATSSLTDSKIYYDTDDHGRDASSYAMSKGLDSNTPFLDMNNAFSELSKLKPDTVYYFVIQDAAGVSPTFSFRTVPSDPSTPLAIITGGDSRDNRSPRKKANLLVSKLRASAVFFGGDMVSTDSATLWKEWFDDWQATIASDGRMTPILAGRGNHEPSNEVPETLFNTPKGVYYAFNFGGNLLRAYTLNTESSISGTQTEWLKDDLKTHTTELWRLANYHKPMRPHVGDKVEGTAQYSNWADLFYKSKMNLVIESDAHDVKSTWPIKPSSAAGSDQGFERDDERGTVYIGEGCWGAPLREANDIKKWTRASGSFNHFNWIFINKERIEIRTVKVDNAKDVAELADGESFTMPAGIDIWAPTSGAVVTLKPIP